MIRTILAKMGITDRQSFYKTLRELAGFGVVGATNIAVQYGVYHILLNMRIHYVVCNIFAFVATVLNSYLWYSLFVFKPKYESMDPVSDKMNQNFAGGKRFLRMLITNIGYLILSSGLIIVFVQVVGVSEEIAPLICIGILIPYSFLVTKLWVYRK